MPTEKKTNKKIGAMYAFALLAIFVFMLDFSIPLLRDMSNETVAFFLMWGAFILARQD